ncbi:MAG: hypothetical protein AAFR35_01460 [Pseudomonadota bacterium]
MSNDWILDVIADLEAFAHKNNLPALADTLGDTALVAATEIASVSTRSRGSVDTHVEQAGTVYRTYAAGHDAR